MPDLPEEMSPPTDVSPDGVDLTLIRAFLALTPAQRLEWLDDRVGDLDLILERLERLGGR